MIKGILFVIAVVVWVYVLVTGIDGEESDV
jgi:hypothetical protein